MNEKLVIGKIIGYSIYRIDSEKYNNIAIIHTKN